MQTNINDSLTKLSFKGGLSNAESRIKIRLMSADDWIERYASGTLRKNKRLGMAWFDQYVHERVAFEYGYGFECPHRTRITFGDASTQGDCKPITEAGWFIDRHIEIRVFAEDYYETKYIIVETEGSPRREGIGMVLRETSSPWIPAGRLVFSIVAHWSYEKQTFLPAINPS